MRLSLSILLALLAGTAQAGEPWSGLGLVALDGSTFDASTLDGKAVLVVNVASRCGLTPQYEGLQKLAAEHRDAGLVVLGAPCNQFAGQEPGSAEDIQTFCSRTYGVDFPLLAKQKVNGKERSALYAWLVGSEAGGGKDISWNFEKFLVGRDGAVVQRFAPSVTPEDAGLRAAVGAALKQ